MTALFQKPQSELGAGARAARWLLLPVVAYTAWSIAGYGFADVNQTASGSDLVKLVLWGVVAVVVSMELRRPRH